MPSLSERVVNRLVIAAVTIGFLILIGIGAMATYTVARNLEFTKLVTHTREVQQTISDYEVLSERMEAARRGYLLSPTPSFVQNFLRASAELPATMERIETLTRDNPRQQAHVRELRAIMADQLASGENTFKGNRAAILKGDMALDPGVIAIRKERPLTAAMIVEETKLLGQRDAARARSVSSLIVVAIGGAVMLVLVAGGSLLIILNYTRDLAASRAELQQLNAGLEDAVKARTADLQRANEEIQRFAYIVSHDLRSPLVNVMGFTSELEAAIKPLTAMLEKAESDAPQLVTADARRTVREELPESIAFIRTSTQKMDRLINAILQLSRQGRRVLTPEPVDMHKLLSAITDGVRHRTDELGGEIHVDANLPRVVSDRLALEQVFSNLVENALKYTRPGQPPQITLRGRREAGRVIYEVQDNGRGIAPKDHERIFELFRRAGAQDQPGEGIGLAHVRALVYRLGGLISVDSRLDEGSTFRVSLPAQLVIEGSAG